MTKREGIISTARSMYQQYHNSDDLVICDDAEITPAKGGYWVTAELWVADESDDEDGEQTSPAAD